MGDATETHIASIVVQARPDAVDAVASWVAGLPGAQVHAAVPAGKIIATFEAEAAGPILDAINRIQGREGVINAALVYQHVESAETMDEDC
jgi:nitrate reductase NapD